MLCGAGPQQRELQADLPVGKERLEGISEQILPRGQAATGPWHGYLTGSPHRLPSPIVSLLEDEISPSQNEGTENVDVK